MSFAQKIDCKVYLLTPPNRFPMRQHAAYQTIHHRGNRGYHGWCLQL